MEKSGLVKFSYEKARGSNRFSLGGKMFTGRVHAEVVKVLNQIYGPGDFQGKKVSPVEKIEGAMVDRPDREDRRNPAGPDFFG